MVPVLASSRTTILRFLCAINTTLCNTKKARAPLLVTMGATMSAIKDHTGKKFGRLIVLSRAENRAGRTAWSCRCDCGATTIVTGLSLVTGHTQSCGCFQRDATSLANSKHGFARGQAPEYYAWKGMIRRCTDKNNKFYKNYGGRGIVVCREWMDVERFMADMGKRPDGCSLERVDNDKGYCPSNCRWATRKEQERNKRSNRLVEFNGQKITLAEFSEKTGIPRDKIDRRLRNGWSVAAIMATQER